MSATGTEAAVCADIAQRQQVGIAKYGTTVRENPLNLLAWLQHAYEETLDQAVYLKRAIEELDKGAKETAKPAPIPEGFTAWNGGSNPAPGAQVEVFFREGLFASDLSEDFAWWHDGEGCDIIAYKVIA